MKGKGITEDAEAEGSIDGGVDDLREETVAEVGGGNRVVAGLGGRSGSDNGWVEC